jgi:transposase InsO family protein
MSRMVTPYADLWRSAGRASTAAYIPDNGYVERLIGSIRRECLDHVVVFGQAHLRRILTNYAAYYNESALISRLGRTPP